MSNKQIKITVKQAIVILCPLIPGVIILAISFLYGVFVVSLPYQDAPPDLELKWRAKEKIMEKLWAAGGITLEAGLALVAVLLVVRMVMVAGKRCSPTCDKKSETPLSDKK